MQEFPDLCIAVGTACSKSPLGQELLVISNLAHLAFVHDDDFVCSLNG